MNRREFVALTTGAFVGGAGRSAFPALEPASEPKRIREFRLWAMGDSHVGTDLRHKRESLADAIRQSEKGGEEGGPAFDWAVGETEI